jgi:hypothetical protein
MIGSSFTSVICRRVSSETLSTVGAQETGGKQIKHKTQKDEQHELHQNTVANQSSRDGKSLPASYKIPSVKFI